MGIVGTEIQKTGIRGKPSLRQHASGNWFYSVNGKNRYLGKDFAQAQSVYFVEVFQTFTDGPKAVAPSVPQLAQLPLGIAPQLAQGEYRNAPTAIPEAPKAIQTLTLKEGFRMLFESMPDCPGVTKWKQETSTLLKMHGKKLVAEISVADLVKYKKSMADYSPWTKNSRYYVLRKLFKFLDESGYQVPKVPSSILKGERILETQDKAIDPVELREIYQTIKKENQQLALCIRLQFLLALRPWRLPEVLADNGTWESDFVFVLDRSKTEKKTGTKQRVVFSMAALQCLKKITIRFNSGQTYRQTCTRIVNDFTPHHLRHTAATELAKLDVPDEIIETALGHVMPLVKRTYRRPKYEQTALALQKLAKILPE